MSARPRSSWRPALRLARRDARRHLGRTVLASALIALPVTALLAVSGFQSGGGTSVSHALASVPDGAQAVLTATAIPPEDPPFRQDPEGPQGLWMDDEDVVPAGTDELAALLPARDALAEYWLSPDLIASPVLGIEPGAAHTAGHGADALTSVDLSRVGTARLVEAEPAALPLLAPALAEGRLPVAPDELLVSRALAQRLALSPGDTLGLLAAPDTGWRSTAGNVQAAMEDSERGYRVVGIADSPDDTAWASPGWLSSLASAHPHGLQRHWLVLGEEPVTWEQVRALNERQAFALSRHVLTHYPPADQLDPVPVSAATYLTQAVTVALTGAVGALLVIFLITPAFAVSAEQSRRTLGIAAAAGAAPRDLRRTVLAQGLFVGLVGGIAGAVLGPALALAVAAWVDSQGIADPSAGGGHRLASTLAHFPWPMLALAVVLAVGLGALSALPPALTASRLSPVDALRDRRSPRPARTRRRVLLGLGGPLLLVTGIGICVVLLMWPIPEIPVTDPPAVPGSAPPGTEGISLAVVLAVLCAAAGLTLCVGTLVRALGRLAARTGPSLRLALRDAADHPSRTAPAALGVLFAVAAASFLLVWTGSSAANHRDSRTTNDWDGTFAVSPAVTVTDHVDRLVSRAAIDQARRHAPEITGSVSISEVAAASSVFLRVEPPEEVACPPGELPHAESAIDPDAPRRCVSQSSGAAFLPQIGIGGLGAQSDTVLFPPEALRATGLPGADAAADVLARGGVVVSDASLLGDDGRVRVTVVPVSAGEGGDAHLLPGVFVRGLGTPFLLAPDTAERLGVDALHYLGEIAVVSVPIDAARLRAIRDDSPLTVLSLPEIANPLDPANEPAFAVLTWTPLLLLGGLAVAATAVAVLLSAGQARKDAATVHALGGDRGLLVRLGLVRAGILLSLGVPWGLLSGLGLGVFLIAWNRHLGVSGAWLRIEPMWEAQAVLVGGVILAGLACAAILGRPPRRFERRGLD